MEQGAASLSRTLTCTQVWARGGNTDEAEMTRVNAITTSKQLKCFYLAYLRQQPARGYFRICLSLRGLATD